MATRNIVPRATGEGNIGTSLKHWLKGWFNSLFVSGNLTDGSNDISIAQTKTAYDHTSLTNNPHTVTKTQIGLSAVTNDAQIKSADFPGSSVSGNIATMNGTSGKSIQDSGKAHSTDGTFASNSDNKIPTEKAIKTYIDTRSIDFQYAESNAETSTTSALFINKVTLTWTPPANGDYIIDWYFEYSNSAAGNDNNFRVQLNSSDILSTRQSSGVSQGNNGWGTIQGFIKSSLTNTSNSVTIDLNRIAGTSYIKNARIKAYRVA